MKKSLKILIFSCICIFTISSNCLAVNIDMNLPGNTNNISSNVVSSETANSIINYNDTNSLNSNTVDNTYDQFGDATYNSNTTSNTLSQNNSSSSSSSNKSNIADTLQSLPEAELGLTNILNILLITVGVVLILLAIAIFIRLKK